MGCMGHVVRWNAVLWGAVANDRSSAYNHLLFVCVIVYICQVSCRARGGSCEDKVFCGAIASDSGRECADGRVCCKREKCTVLLWWITPKGTTTTHN